MCIIIMYFELLKNIRNRFINYFFKFNVRIANRGRLKTYYKWTHLLVPI